MPFVFMRAPLLLVLTMLAACGRGDARDKAGLVDDFGAPVHAGTPRDPARIVSLDPGSTEILFALGAGPRVVGRTHWDVWPDAARRVPDVGPGIRPNVEAVLARKPALVVLYASADNRPAARRLESAGVAVLALKTDRIADFARTVRLLGVATGEQDAAAVVVDSVRRTLDRVRSATAGLDRPRVFWPAWEAPPTAIGGGSFLSELVEIAGGRNIYADLPAPSPVVSLEDVIRRDPDVLLVSPAGAARIRSDPAWQAIPAVRDGHLLEVDTTLVLRPSVRLGEAAVSLARLLHAGALP
jgi:ABC-type Fe3+-hydroxamate transport system substrate-binding protein